MVLSGVARVASGLLVLAVVPTSAFSEDRSVVVRESRILPGQYDVIEDGKRVGTVKKHPFIDGQFEVFNQSGKREKTIRSDPFIDGQYEIRGADGRRVGTLRQDPFLENQYELRDESGKRTGTVRQNPFLSRELEVDIEP
jgi:hypothetical protein